MLGPGNTAPDFELPCAINGRASKIHLAELRSELTVIFFYPRDFSFICPTEVTGFNQALKSFEDAKCEVLGISGDSVESHLEWARSWAESITHYSPMTVEESRARSASSMRKNKSRCERLSCCAKIAPSRMRSRVR